MSYILEALKKSQALLEDARDERAFLGKQTSMHIKVAELKREVSDLLEFVLRVVEEGGGSGQFVTHVRRHPGQVGGQ